MSTIRSCLACRRRKIRCDKELPCSYCVKTGLQCEYPDVATPSSSRRPDRPSGGSSPAVDTRTRIEALEAQVSHLASRLSNIESPGSRANALSIRYAPGVFLDPRPDLPAFESPASTPTSGGFALRLSPQGEVPTPWWPVDHYRELWLIYLADIDPCLKIVDHQFVENTLNAYPDVDHNGMAILIAIGLATTSCKNPEALTAYQNYAKALEKVLQDAKILTQPTTPTLQALTIYLSCGRLNMAQDYLCTMLLLLVRLATQLQLDEDPADLGFDSRECELRRRLWWQIVTLDVRTAESCGSNPMIVARHIRTKLPAMIKDISLSGGEDLESLDHAPCTFYAVMAFEMAKIARQVLFALESTPEQDTRRNEVRLRALCDQLHHALLTQYGKTCNCVDSPICRLTVQWCSIYWTRLKLLVMHSKRLFLRQVTEETTSDEEKDLLACIGILERVERLRADVEYSRYAWLWQNGVEWDASAIALCMIVTGKCSMEVVSRAWMALDTFFQIWNNSSAFGDPARRKRWRELVAFRDWVQNASLGASPLHADDTSMIMGEEE